MDGTERDWMHEMGEVLDSMTTVWQKSGVGAQKWNFSEFWWLKVHFPKTNILEGRDLPWYNTSFDFICYIFGLMDNMCLLFTFCACTAPSVFTWSGSISKTNLIILHREECIFADRYLITHSVVLLSFKIGVISLLSCCTMSEVFTSEWKCPLLYSAKDLI